MTADRWLPCDAGIPAFGSDGYAHASRVADRLDVVAVGIEHEGAVVVGVVVGPEARCAVVAAADGERGGMKPVDDGPVVGGERDVDALALRPAAAHPEERLAVRAEAGGGSLPVCSADTSMMSPMPRGSSARA